MQNKAVQRFKKKNLSKYQCVGERNHKNLNERYFHDFFLVFGLLHSLLQEITKLYVFIHLIFPLNKKEKENGKNKSNSFEHRLLLLFLSFGFYCCCCCCCCCTGQIDCHYNRELCLFQKKKKKLFRLLSYHTVTWIMRRRRRRRRRNLRRRKHCTKIMNKRKETKQRLCSLHYKMCTYNCRSSNNNNDCDGVEFEWKKHVERKEHMKNEKGTWRKVLKQSMQTAAIKRKEKKRQKE